MSRIVEPRYPWSLRVFFSNNLNEVLRRFGNGLLDLRTRAIVLKYRRVLKWNVSHVLWITLALSEYIHITGMMRDGAIPGHHSLARAGFNWNLEAGGNRNMKLHRNKKTHSAQRSLVNVLRRLASDESGQDMIEYALMTGFVVGISIAATPSVFVAVAELFARIPAVMEPIVSL